MSVVSFVVVDRTMETLTGGKSRIQNIYINTDVNLGTGNSILQPVNDALCAFSVKVSGCNDIETTTLVVLAIVLSVGHWRTDTGMD